jgi:AraC family transcriptional regulator of arabinose operon
MVEHMDHPAAITPTLPPGILISGHFTKPFGYFGNRPNGTRDWLLTFTISGEGVYRIEQEEFICRAGDMVILKPGTMHDYAAKQDSVWDFYWAHFVPPFDWVDYLLLPEAISGLIHYHIEHSPTRKRMVRALQQVIEDSRDLNLGSKALALHSLEEVFLLTKQSLDESLRTKLDFRVEEILSTLSQRMKNQYQIEELAQSVNLSPSRLAHLFKEQTGDSIMETLLKIRMRHAAHFLEFTSRKIADIASDVGFQDSFYFSRQFKAFYGNSPSAYRKKLWG